MYRLFWKIFAWFWLATIAIVAATAWSTGQLYRDFTSPMHEWGRIREARQAQAAVAILETRGRRGLADWLSGIPDLPWDRRRYLLDENGRNVLGGGLPPAVARLGEEIRSGADVSGRVQERPRIVVTPATSAAGRRFFMVSTGGPPRSPRPGIRGPHFDRHPEFAGLRIAVAIAVSGLVCLWLAWYLSRPVRSLRAATRQIAAGEFDVRVREAIGHRRDEIADLGRDFDHMAERLQSLLEAQRQLLSDVSHELRSPLARVQVALGLARQRGGDAIQSELDRIERECEVLNDLIGQLLSLARLESAGAGNDFVEVALADLLSSVARDAAFEAEQSGRRVDITRCEEAALRGSPELLRSAFENIVRNAVRHTAAGTAVEVALSGVDDGGSAVLTVRDHGPGVPEELLGRLFEPFVRAGAARDRESGGFGLGLSIARRAVELHGGAIAATNAEGGGLVVTVHLPLSR